MVFQLKSTEDMKIWFEVVEEVFCSIISSWQAFLVNILCALRLANVTSWCGWWGPLAKPHLLPSERQRVPGPSSLCSKLKQRSSESISWGVECWVCDICTLKIWKILFNIRKTRGLTPPKLYCCILPGKSASSGSADVGFGSELGFEESWKMEPLFGMQLMYPCESMCRGVKGWHNSCKILPSTWKIQALRGWVGGRKWYSLGCETRHEARARWSLQASLTHSVTCCRECECHNDFVFRILVELVFERDCTCFC